MRLYLAGAETSRNYSWLKGLDGVFYLFSYYYLTKGKTNQKAVVWSNENGIPLFLDSGAFSAYQSDLPVQVDEYIDYCLEHGSKFEVIASLDVIGDHKKTLVNHHKMLKAGIKSIPTFHVMSPFTALRDLLLEDNDYIALGVAGMQGRRKSVMAWITKCFRIIEKHRPECRVHGFALTSPLIMGAFPWWSVDSTTWLAGRRFGRVFLREGNKLKLVDIRNLNHIVKNIKGLRELLNGPTRGRPWHKKVDIYNARRMIEWTQFLTKRKLNT